MEDERDKIIFKIAMQIDQVGVKEDVEWLFPTRWAQVVAARLVEAAEAPENTKRLVDREAYSDLSAYVIERYQGRVEPQRREVSLDAISELLEVHLSWRRRTTH
jgi:hypothetical protein